MRRSDLEKAFLDITSRGAAPRGWCCSCCGKRCGYPPIKVPSERPKSIEGSPGQLETYYVSICIDCIRGKAGAILMKEIRLGNLTPKRCWCIKGDSLELVNLEPE